MNEATGRLHGGTKCEGKARHETKAKALAHLVHNNRNAPRGARYAAYYCEHCQGFHCGTRTAKRKPSQPKGKRTNAHQ